MTVTRKYSLVIEGEDGGYSAYVPELPTILITGRSLDEVASRAKEAIKLYWSELDAGRSPTSLVQEIEVELPV
jgi:predicted RNase H-like HicB family nuclease